MGPNGAGKSTLLRVLAGQAPAPWQGWVELLGQDLAPQRPLCQRARLAVVPQGAPLVGRLSARDNVLTGALARCGALGSLGLLPRRHPGRGRRLARPPEPAPACTHAGRQALGRRAPTRRHRPRALQRPQLLLADEATAQLDPPRRRASLRLAAAGGGRGRPRHRAAPAGAAATGGHARDRSARGPHRAGRGCGRQRRAAAVAAGALPGELSRRRGGRHGNDSSLSPSLLTPSTP